MNGHAWVTGATGFVGGHVVDRLLREGMAVTCLVRASSVPGRLQDLPVRLVAADPLAWDDALRSAGAADLAVHAAGLTRARSEADYVAANATATECLVRGMQATGLLPRRLVLVSSLAAAGPTPIGQEPPDEGRSPAPHDAYGRSKLAGEAAVARLADGMAWTVVRPPAVYGPRDRNFLPLFRTALRTGVFPAMGGRDKVVAMVHVEDLAEGLLQAAQCATAAGQAYFISGGNHTVDELAEAVGAAVGRRLRVVSVPALAARLLGECGELLWSLTGRAQLVSRRKMRDLLQPRWTCATAKAAGDFGFRPRFTLVDGMRQTAAWYREAGWLA